MEREVLIKSCEEILRYLEGRLQQLEELRDRDIDKEILDTLNDIGKYKRLLKELSDET